jgi:hypothetical protein
MGIIVGGIILAETTTTGFYISTGYKDVPGLVLLLLYSCWRSSPLVYSANHPESDRSRLTGCASKKRP